MRHVTVVEAKSHFSALLAEVDGGAEIEITRHGKVVARLVPARPVTAADAFRKIWALGGLEMDEINEPDIPPDDVNLD
ncbi:type II toxin-antitoxin system prevent-host-death family antitoxin [Acidovorax sp. YS12]|nr:type II toxin-antitoxin system prevent-host-death family antitoxin [Acidovorax sp. YS12]